MIDEDILLALSTRRDWLMESPLGPVLPSYITALRHRQYADQTIAAYLRAIAHVAVWMSAEGISLQNLDEAVLPCFLKQHLPLCTCPIPRHRNHADLHAAWNHLLKLLCDDHWVEAQVGEPETPVSAELTRFRQYLADCCGLAVTTCDTRVKHVQVFLSRHFGTSAVDLAKLTPAQIETFVMSYTGRWTPASLHVLRDSLSSYFRFKALSGEVADACRVALPRPAVWSYTALPKVLSDAQLATFLSAFDRSTSIGLRDYAIARCLVDLGLRGQEVADLALDDLDWHLGSVTIRGGKAKRIQVLPMPPQTGEAVVQYLRRGRPKTLLRRLFVRHRAPAEAPLSTAAIRNVANRAFQRCGLDEQFHNTHVLRRSLASRLQVAGSSAKAIADVLRHRSLDTAARYLCVDLERLRSVALPWPGRSQ